MSALEWYDRQGRPITWDRAEALLARGLAYKLVARTAVGPHEVSTVWLGLDHNFTGGPPLIFETLVFPACEECYRYPTEAAAIAGHDQCVARLRDEHEAALRLMHDAAEAREDDEP